MRGRAARTLYTCFVQAGGAARGDDSADGWLVEHFRPVNLFEKPQPVWDAARARTAASQLKYREIDWLCGDRVVMLGRRVATAMQFVDFRWFQVASISEHPIGFLLLPHPSGMNRLMNDPKTRRRVGQALRWAIETP